MNHSRLSAMGNRTVGQNELRELVDRSYAINLRVLYSNAELSVKATHSISMTWSHDNHRTGIREHFIYCKRTCAHSQCILECWNQMSIITKITKGPFLNVHIYRFRRKLLYTYCTKEWKSHMQTLQIVARVVGPGCWSLELFVVHSSRVEEQLHCSRVRSAEAMCTVLNWTITIMGELKWTELNWV